MEKNFREEEKCVCCGKTGCSTCDCTSLQEDIEEEKTIGRTER